jgi:hypothetical protein
MGNIGIPEIVIAGLVIGIPVWAYRGFPLPKKAIERYVLLSVLTLLCGALVYNWMTPIQAITP